MARILAISLYEGQRAVRTLWRTPRFTLCVLGLVTIAIGTATALGSAGYELLSPRLPYGSPEHLAMVWSDLPKAGYWRAPLSGLELADLRTNIHGLSGIAAMFPGNVTLEQGGEPIQVSTTTVTANLFDVLQVAPVLGRSFQPADEGRNKPPTMILSWQTWHDRFGADPSIIGRKVDVGSNVRIEVIGVMPASFQMIFPPDANIPVKTEAWLPFSQDLNAGPRNRYFIRLVARVRDDTTTAATSDEIRALVTKLTSQNATYTRTGRTIYLVNLGQDLALPVRVPSLALLSAGLVLVLLVVVSLTGLWIARSAVQQQEQSIHQMLGASVARVWGQFVAQAVVLSVVGSGLGVAAGLAGLAMLRAIRPLSLARIDHATLTAPVMLALGAVVMVLMLILAVVSRAALAPFASAGAARARVSSAPRSGMRATLVVTQIALALVFLVCSALWTRTLIRVLQIDAGFQPEQALTFRFSLNNVPLYTSQAINDMDRQLMETITAIPGVTAAGTISHLPFDPFPNWAMSYHVSDPSEEAGREADARPVSPGFLKAIGGRLRAGRFFEERDDLNAPSVVIVDRLLADRAWPGEDPIGKELRINTTAGQPAESRTVIGVVEHIRYRAIEAQVREQIFLPHRQFTRGPLTCIVRTSGDMHALIATIRGRVQQVDPRIPIWDERSLDDIYREATAERRFTAALMVCFGVISLILTAIGVYGLLAFLVTSRRAEFGVRLALGAERQQVVQGVVREGLRWAAIGVVIGGTAMALSFSRLKTALYGVTPFDPFSWGGAAGLLLVVVALASWLPALRAGRTDPSLLMKSQ